MTALINIIIKRVNLNNVLKSVFDLTEINEEQKEVYLNNKGYIIST